MLFFLSLPNTDVWMGKLGLGFATARLGDCAGAVLLLCSWLSPFLLPEVCRELWVTSAATESRSYDAISHFPSLCSYTLLSSCEFITVKCFKICLCVANEMFGLCLQVGLILFLFHVNHLIKGLYVVPFLGCLLAQWGGLLSTEITVWVSPAPTVYCSFKPSALCNTHSSPPTVSQQRINP